MKKYQLWLQRKTYSQHLNNLMRIKLESSERRPSCQPQRASTRSSKQPESSLTKDSSLFLSPRDLSYIITARELQRHKLRLVRSNEIVRENQQMVKRLNKVRPFVASSRPPEPSGGGLKRSMQRANELRSAALKDQNYRRFQQDYRQGALPAHKYLLTLTLHRLDQRLPASPSAELALEVAAHAPLARSEYLPPHALSGHTFRFSFAEPLAGRVTVRVHQVRGLEHSVASEFEVEVGEEGERREGEWGSRCGLAALSATLTYARLKPKFWSVKLFRV